MRHEAKNFPSRRYAKEEVRQGTILDWNVKSVSIILAGLVIIAAVFLML